MGRLRLNLILAGYRLVDTRRAIVLCERLAADGFEGRLILVLNRGELAGELRGLSVRWEIVEGSNSLGEFSAWQEGLDLLGSDGLPVAFLNDSASTHRVFSRFRRRAFVDAVRSARGACHVGFIDRASGQFSVAGKPLDRWVSTYCFALTAEAIERLEQRLTVSKTVDACVPGGEVEASFFDRLSPDLTRHMQALLFGGGWYASAPLTSENSGSFRFKARCVIAEKLLAARCIELEVQLVDPFFRRPLLEQLDRTASRGVRGLRKILRKLRGKDQVTAAQRR